MLQKSVALTGPTPATREAAESAISYGVASGGVQRNMLDVIWRRRWIIAVAMAVCLLAAAAYLARAIRLYSATSQLYVQQHSLRVLGESSLYPSNAAENIATQCQLIQSTPVLSEAVELPGVRQTKALAGMDSPVGALKSMLTAEPAKNGDFITVSAECASPQDAALLVNSVVQAYIGYLSKTQKSTVADVLKILSSELGKREKELDDLSKKMVAFRQANGMLSFESNGGNVVTQRFAELSAVLAAAELQTLDAKLACDSVDAAGDDPAKLRQLLAIDGNGKTPLDASAMTSQLWTEYRQLQRRATKARRIGSENPEAKQAEEDLELLAQELSSAQKQSVEVDKSAVANYRTAVYQRWINAQKKEDELRKAYDAQRTVAMELNAKSAEYGKLEMDLRRTERLCDTLDARIKEINLNDDAAPFTANVLEVARPPTAPVKPQKARILGMALIIGILVGFGGAMLLDVLDHRLRSADEIAAALGLPILGTVPRMERKRTVAERGLEVHASPRSAIAESYRTLRTAIDYGASRAGYKVLLVTSPSPGEGKTTTASNLSLILAQTGKRVLLIDADCRRPRQHRIFQLSVAGCGLVSALKGHPPKLDGAVCGTVLGTTLDVLPCGDIPSNPAEILNDQRFRLFVADVATAYDYVIIDSPPVVPITDARILANLCDAVVLVLRADTSTRRMAEHARDSLQSVGGNILGVVVNDVPRGRAGYGYSYGYAYGSYYGQDDSEESDWSRGSRRERASLKTLGHNGAAKSDPI